jgi:hypothetical protein
MLFAAPVSNFAPVVGSGLSLPAAPPIASLAANTVVAYYHAAPIQNQPALLNNRQLQPTSSNSSTSAPASLAVSTTPATLSSSGLQPASQGLVSREYGYSSAYVAQWLSQSANNPEALAALSIPGYRNLALPSPAALTAFAEIKYLPSNASVPQPSAPIAVNAPDTNPANSAAKIPIVSFSGSKAAPVAAAASPSLNATPPLALTSLAPTSLAIAAVPTSAAPATPPTTPPRAAFAYAQVQTRTTASATNPPQEAADTANTEQPVLFRRSAVA